MRVLIFIRFIYNDIRVFQTVSPLLFDQKCNIVFNRGQCPQPVQTLQQRSEEIRRPLPSDQYGTIGMEKEKDRKVRGVRPSYELESRSRVINKETGRVSSQKDSRLEE